MTAVADAGVWMSELERMPNVEYRGIFDSVAGDVVKELNQYDIQGLHCQLSGFAGNRHD